MREEEQMSRSRSRKRRRTTGTNYPDETRRWLRENIAKCILNPKLRRRVNRKKGNNLPARKKAEAYEQLLHEANKTTD